MANKGFDVAMKEHNIKVVSTNVGDRYVIEEMRKNNYNLGGEQSGHIIFLDEVTTGGWHNLRATDTAHNERNRKIIIRAGNVHENFSSDTY